jgi:hypothetical protein
MGGSKKKGKPDKPKAKTKPASVKKSAAAGKKPASKAPAKPPKPAGAKNTAPAAKKVAVKSPGKTPDKKAPVAKAPTAKGEIGKAKSAASKPEGKTAAKSEAKGQPKLPAPGKSVPDSAKKGAAKAAPKGTAAPVADPNIKRPARPFFIEVKPGSERVIKRGDKSLAAPAPLDIQSRRKGTTADETPEELVERIERELEHQFFAKRNALKPQMCTKCGINVVAERFTIDRELGYCSECAEILRLGETKEARRMEFNPSVMKSEPEAKPAPESGKDEEEQGGEESVPEVE